MKKIALVDPKKRYSFKILSKEQVTHDTLKFVLKSVELPSSEHQLGAKAGQHVFVIGKDGTYRKYTPISL